MKREDKESSMIELKNDLQNCTVAVMTQYVGITVEKVTELRKKLRASNVKFKVYKNTLATRVLNELNLSGAAKFMDGPTAWAISKDPVAPPKILKEFAKDAKMVVMVGGIVENQVVTAKQLEALSNLPPRDVLLGQVVGTIAMPLRNFVGALNALPTNLVNVLDQIKKQKEEASA